MALTKQSARYHELDTLVDEGKAQLIGTPLADTGTTPTIVTAQAGEVVIITKLVGMVHPSSDTSPGLSDAGSFQTLRLYDENGDATNEKLIFLAHQRVDAAFWSPSSIQDSWRSAVPPSPIVWDFEEPLVIPPSHTLRALNDDATTLAGGNFAVYGYTTDVGTARMLGYSTGSQDITNKAEATGVMTSTKIVNTGGFRGGAVSGAAAEAVSIVPARTGYSIQIIDLHIRAQPMHTGSTARTAVLCTSTSLTLATTDVALVDTAVTLPILHITNNNHNALAEWKMAPRIYMPPSYGVYLVPTSLTDVVRCSVNVTYRYVPNAEVPVGSWWKCTIPTIPGSSTNTVGTTSLYTDGSTAVVPYYPGRTVISQSQPTSGAPGTGYQHVVEGFAVSAQKDSTIANDRAYFSLTSGSADGNIGISGGGLSTTNNPICPIMCAGSHDQCFALGVDGLNIPILKETGAVRIEITGRGAAALTPASASLHFSSSAPFTVSSPTFSVLVWGRTIPAKFSTGHFRGAAS